MKKRIILIIAAIILCINAIILIPIMSKPDYPTEDESSKKFYLYFDKNNYPEYIQNRVKFENINLDVVSIKKGDNFWKIARDHGVNIDTLIGSNPHWDCLTARVEQKIVVPSKIGVLHFIENFDEINTLKERYNTKKKNIIIQDLPFLYRLYYRLLDNRSPIAVFIKDAKPCSDFMTDKLAKQYELREKFRSPLGGRFSSFFGKRIHPIFRYNSFHNGLDIAARYGTMVGAARDGVVVAAGWMGGYGNAVIIKHENGYQTLYGHLSRISTRYGRNVKAGQIIGRVGSTGLSTGNHLHFTLWHYDKLINPMSILW